MSGGLKYRSGVEPPERIWWKKVHKTEKVWVWIAFGWCMVLFAMMPLWHLRGGQKRQPLCRL